MPEFCEDVATGHTESTSTAITTALTEEMAQLKTAKAIILEQRNAEITAARNKYANALKKITAKQGALKRMIKTAESKLQ